MLEKGLSGYQKKTVGQEDTARVHGSGTLEVLATPVMTALMEETCWKSVTEYLEPGMGTVGTKLDISHLAPTPVGMEVYCESQLTEVDGRRLVFAVQAYDEAGKIGGGTHERFIIREEAFQKKADQKRGEQ